MGGPTRDRRRLSPRQGAAAEATRGALLGAIAEAGAQLNAHKDHSLGGSLNLALAVMPGAVGLLGESGEMGGTRSLRLAT
jgi:hypothetical protein